MYVLSLIKVGHAALATSICKSEHSLSTSSSFTIKRVALPGGTLLSDRQSMLMNNRHTSRLEPLALQQHAHAAQIILALVTRIEHALFV